MTRFFSPIRCGLWAAAALLSSASPGIAQEAAVPPSPLEQLEATYQAELKKLHAPLLAQYAADLQRLAAQTTSATDAAAVAREQQRVQRILEGDGIVDLSIALRLSKEPESEAPMPGTPPVPPRQRAALLTLLPATANKIHPAPTDPSRAEASAFDSITWHVTDAPADTYEVILHYALAAPLPRGLALHLSWDHVELDHVFTEEDVTGATDHFGILSLGTIRLDADAIDEHLTLHLDHLPALEESPFRLRQLMIVHSRLEPRATAPAESAQSAP
ncbi:MAG: hypothetical protein KDK99_06025 [Verrucomicrobiales bacterium]|nr:hypothetical protein [Verrucomicrobiales bacterium]